MVTRRNRANIDIFCECRQCVTTTVLFVLTINYKGYRNERAKC